MDQQGFQDLIYDMWYPDEGRQECACGKMSRTSSRAAYRVDVYVIRDDKSNLRSVGFTLSIARWIGNQFSYSFGILSANRGGELGIDCGEDICVMPVLSETPESLLIQLAGAADAVAWDEFVAIYHPVVVRKGLQATDTLIWNQYFDEEKANAVRTPTHATSRSTSACTGTHSRERGAWGYEGR